MEKLIFKFHLESTGGNSSAPIHFAIVKIKNSYGYLKSTSGAGF